MHNDPLVSVCMSVYDESEIQLEKAINSILKQTYRNLELVIVLDKAENIKAKQKLLDFQNKDNRIKLIFNKKNMSLAWSLNKAISIAKGDFIARMDADDTCHPEKLTKQVNFFKENLNTQILFTQWTEVDGEGKELIREPKEEYFQHIEKFFFIRSMLLHASMMAKREMFETYQYPVMSRPEDFTMFLEMIKDKVTFSLLQEPLYNYYIHSLAPDKKFNKIRTYSANYLTVLFKNIWHFKFNIYFYFALFRTFVEWTLSRNIKLFELYQYLESKLKKYL